MQERSTLSFIRKVSRASQGRLSISLPPEVATLITTEQKYEVTLRPVGSLVLTAGRY